MSGLTEVCLRVKIIQHTALLAPAGRPGADACADICVRVRGLTGEKRVTWTAAVVVEPGPNSGQKCC